MRPSAPVWCSELSGARSTAAPTEWDMPVRARPLIVHRDQHFFSRNTGLTCCAATGFRLPGQSRRRAGCLRRIGPGSAAHARAREHVGADDREPAVPQPFPRYVRGALPQPAGLVGTWVKHHRAGPLRHHRGTGPQRPVPTRVQSASEVVGAPLERVFNISLPALVGRSQKKSFHALPIYETRHGGGSSPSLKRLSRSDSK